MRKKTDNMSEGFDRSHSEEDGVSDSVDSATDCANEEVVVAEGDSSFSSSLTVAAPLYMAERMD